MAKRRQSEDYEDLMDTFYLSENSGHSFILEHTRTDWIADYLHSRRSSSRHSDTANTQSVSLNVDMDDWTQNTQIT